MRKIAEKMRKTDCDKYKKIVKIFLMFCIGFYPFMTSFYGIDLGDTGIHMFNYENIFSNPELIGFTSYFTSVTGWMWLNVFPGLGIWGLNLRLSWQQSFTRPLDKILVSWRHCLEF